MTDTTLYECKQWLDRKVEGYLRKTPDAYVGLRVSLRKGHMLVIIKSKETNNTVAKFYYEVS